GRSTFDRVDQRQRRLAFGQVVADVLAQRLRVGNIIQQVVGDLERETELHAVMAQRLFLLFRQARQHRAQLRRRRKKNGGFAFYDAQVRGLVDVGVAEVKQLQYLAFGDRVGGVGENVHHAHAVQLHHQLER